MKSTYGSREGVALAAVVAVLAMSNILVNRVLATWLYVPWNLAVAAAVLVAVRAVSSPVVTWTDLGFTAWRRGLRWGSMLVAGTLTVLLLAVALPFTRDLFDDDRVDGRVGIMVYHAVLRIPLGTVVLEEVAFRSVLPVLVARRVAGRVEGERRWLWGAVAASLLFGLWHALPAWGLSDVNPVVDRWFGDGAAGQLVAVVAAVSGTFLAGLWFCALRFGSGSILAPVMAHAASNSFAYALAWGVSG